MIINKYYTISLYSEEQCDTVVVKCYVYSYEKVEGSFDFWDVSDLDYYGGVDIEWEVMQVSLGEDMVNIDVSDLSDEDLEHIEQELIKYVEEYLEEEKASCY